MQLGLPSEGRRVRAAAAAMLRKINSVCARAVLLCSARCRTGANLQLARITLRLRVWRRSAPCSAGACASPRRRACAGTVAVWVGGAVKEEKKCEEGGRGREWWVGGVH